MINVIYANVIIKKKKSMARIEKDSEHETKAPSKIEALYHTKYLPMRAMHCGRQRVFKVKKALRQKGPRKKKIYILVIHIFVIYCTFIYIIVKEYRH